MKITYIGHSGVMAETEHLTMLFDCVAEDHPSPDLDYAPGTWPEITGDKPLIVFVSHRHHDHYSFDIWKLKQKYPSVTYVIAHEMIFSASMQRKNGITEEDKKSIFRLYPDRIYEIPVDNMKISVETLESTDCGVAFYVKADGHTIFHTGDLHLWTWWEEGSGYCEEMRRNFEAERIRMQGKEAEAAFLILDPRLEQTAFEGIDAWRKTMKFSHIFPIHEWKQYDFTDKYLEERSTETNGIVHRITGENQTFEI